MSPCPATSRMQDEETHHHRSCVLSCFKRAFFRIPILFFFPSILFSPKDTHPHDRLRVRTMQSVFFLYQGDMSPTQVHSAHHANYLRFDQGHILPMTVQCAHRTNHLHFDRERIPFMTGPFCLLRNQFLCIFSLHFSCNAKRFCFDERHLPVRGAHHANQLCFDQGI